ncbi:acyl-CoA desaturase [Nonomuraea sp. KC401]|uniref:fatty acid desaturase family protein n=1 Tax=unclassified Nonomuraea TaxID=2593643 RepID=UPI0010FE3B06|nr:acyl-CoA desaturase [Nonomuraea sp. KC401]NBE94748.1 acyl-CoA desaturase [Nonomuraea sp. K271]TLF64982.1 acyl-CoA desaturase [Nonomuraea sp. KC401]
MDTSRARPSGERGSDFARLSRRIAQEGLLRKRPGYYAARITMVVALFAASWALFAWVGDSWWQLAVAVLMAVTFGQVTLLAHDLAHGQISRSRRISRIAGLITGNLAIGLSYGWWMDKHTRHHANPNHEDRDPDVSPDFLVWSERQAEASRGLPRFVGRWQALLFFPLLTLEGLNLKVSSFRALRRKSLKNRTLEGLLLSAHVLAYAGVLFLVLPPGLALTFLIVHQACYGVYLGCTFAPNHKGMPVLTAEDELDFLRRQVLTSRNVRGGRLVNTALGGLNYQIEHHLFPSMPTANLRRAQPIVREYCESLGIDYVECGLFQSWGQALRHLHEVGRQLREAPTT